MDKDKEKTKISILGCGWLGKSLAQHLILHGYKIKGSTTTPEKLRDLKQLGIEPHLIDLSELSLVNNLRPFLNQSEIIVINIPPQYKSAGHNYYLKYLRGLLPQLEASGCSRVIFASSTSVYKDDKFFTEATEESGPFSQSAKGKMILEAENIFRLNSKFKTVIIRFGGLIGRDRHPAKYLSGKIDVQNAEAPVNLIHRQDCISIIHHLIKSDIYNQTYNAVYPEHPTKKKYYSKICEQLSIPAPQFNTSSVSYGKSVSSEKSLEIPGFEYRTSIY